MKHKKIGDDFGYSLVNEYLETITSFPTIKKFFSAIDKDYWLESAKCLLNQPHKGSKK